MMAKTPLFSHLKPNDPFLAIMNSDEKPLIPKDDNLEGVKLTLTKFDALFLRAKNPVIINDIVISKTEDRTKLNEMIFTTYDSNEQLAMQASCDCGAISGDYNVGEHCDECDSIVLHVKDKPYESKLWIRAPDGVRALMSPPVYHMLCEQFTRRRMRIFEWAINPGFQLRACSEIDRIKGRFPNFKRGINWIHDNFDEFVDFLFSIRVPMTKAKAVVLRDFITKYRDRIFCTYLPIPSSQIFVKERGGDRIYSDPSIIEAIQAIRTISSIGHAISVITPEEAQRKAITAVKQLSMYYATFIGTPLTDKKGLSRKHVFGSRLFFTARTVITSQHWIHNLDELRLPWGVLISLMRMHIIGILMRRGMNAVEAAQWIVTAMTIYSEEAHDILKELMNVRPEGGSDIRVYLQRNPSLHRLSIQAFYVTSVWTDPNIPTTAISPLVLQAPNADFDGDEMNITLAVDDYSWQFFNRHAPFTGYLDPNKPNSVAGINTLPVTVLEMSRGWLEEENRKLYG